MLTIFWPTLCLLTQKDSSIDLTPRALNSQLKVFPWGGGGGGGGGERRVSIHHYMYTIGVQSVVCVGYLIHYYMYVYIHTCTFCSLCRLSYISLHVCIHVQSVVCVGYLVDMWTF